MRVRDELHFQGHAADWRGRRTPGNGAGWSGFHRQREGAQAAHADGEAGWAAAPCRVQRPPAAALTRERQGAAKAGGRTRPDSRALNCSGRDPGRRVGRLLWGQARHIEMSRELCAELGKLASSHSRVGHLQSLSQEGRSPPAHQGWNSSQPGRVF